MEYFDSDILVAGPGLVACNQVFEQSNEKQYSEYFSQKSFLCCFQEWTIDVFLAILHSCLYIFSCVSGVQFGKLHVRNAQASLSFVLEQFTISIDKRTVYHFLNFWGRKKSQDEIRKFVLCVSVSINFVCYVPQGR